MRYADCPTVTVATVVDAPLPDVWAIVSDVSLPTRFSTELTAVEWLDQDGGPVLGARFIGRSTHPAIGEWETTCEVTALEPRRVFEWSVRGVDGDLSSIWSFWLAEHEREVVLEHRFQMGPGRSGLNVAIDRMPDKEEQIVARRLAEHRANMERTVAGVKELAESARGEGAST